MISRQSGDGKAIPGAAWRAAAECSLRDGELLCGPLVRWMWSTLICNKYQYLDRYSKWNRDQKRYEPSESTVTPQFLREHRNWEGQLSDPVLEPASIIKHLARMPGPAQRNGCISSFATTTRDARDGDGRFIAFDFDAHVSDDQVEALAERNHASARQLYDRIVALPNANGDHLSPLLIDYGRGSLHLWLPLVTRDGEGQTTNVPFSLLRALGEHLTEGLECRPEIYPDAYKDAGGALRLPGLHHTRRDEPRVWTGSEWVEGRPAIDHIMGIKRAFIEVFLPQALRDEEHVRSLAGLQDAARMKRAKSYRSAGSSPAGTPSDNPFADFNARADWSETGLVEAGWTQTSRNTWARPGKSSGTSATTDYEGLPILYVFTSNGRPLAERQTYDKADVFTILVCGGDKSEACRQLLARGYGKKHAPHRGRSDSAQKKDTPSAPGAEPFGWADSLDSATPTTEPQLGPVRGRSEHPGNTDGSGEPTAESPKHTGAQLLGSPDRLLTGYSSSNTEDPASPKVAREAIDSDGDLTEDGLLSGDIGRHKAMVAALAAKAEGLLCKQGVRRSAAGSGKDNRGEHVSFVPKCWSLGCPACHCFRRLSYLDPYCDNIARGRFLCYKPDETVRCRLWTGPKDEWEVIRKHLRDQARDHELTPARYIWVHPKPDSERTVIIFNGPDSGSTLDVIFLEITTDYAATLIADAIQEIPCEARKGFKRYFASPGLLKPPDKEMTAGANRKLNLIYSKESDNPVMPDITLKQMEVAAHICRLKNISVPGTEDTGVNHATKVEFLFSATDPEGNIHRDFCDRWAGIYPYDAPARAPESCREYHPLGYRPPPKDTPRKAALRAKQLDQLAERVFAFEKKLTVQPKGVIGAAKAAALAGGTPEQVAAIRALAGGRNQLPVALTMLRDIYEANSHPLPPWMPPSEAPQKHDSDSPILSENRLPHDAPENVRTAQASQAPESSPPTVGAIPDQDPSPPPCGPIECINSSINNINMRAFPLPAPLSTEPPQTRVVPEVPLEDLVNELRALAASIRDTQWRPYAELKIATRDRHEILGALELLRILKPPGASPSV